MNRNRKKKALNTTQKSLTTQKSICFGVLCADMQKGKSNKPASQYDFPPHSLHKGLVYTHRWEWVELVTCAGFAYGSRCGFACPKCSGLIWLCEVVQMTHKRCSKPNQKCRYISHASYFLQYWTIWIKCTTILPNISVCTIHSNIYCFIYSNIIIYFM